MDDRARISKYTINVNVYRTILAVYREPQRKAESPYTRVTPSYFDHKMEMFYKKIIKFCSFFRNRGKCPWDRAIDGAIDL